VTCGYFHDGSEKETASVRRTLAVPSSDPTLSDFREIRRVGVAMICADRRTDMTKATEVFPRLCEEKYFQLIIYCCLCST
jgi:hypothetical protein